ncbi:hypothetical protein HA466_0045130 [Hirschfeldia incana]|nr:hypothetical protein HA466_0045130 [Hirschfeldia incana]
MMKTVTGIVNSAKPISLSKATTLLSGFVSSETQASQDVRAYLRRAAAVFTELKSVHREIRSAANPNSEARHPKKKKRKENKEEEDVVEEKLEDEERNKERKKKKSKDEDVIDEEVNVKLEEERKETKNRKSDGESKKRRKSKEIDA